MSLLEGVVTLTCLNLMGNLTFKCCVRPSGDVKRKDVELILPFPYLFFFPLRVSVEDPSSELAENALTSFLNAKKCEGEEGGNTEHGQLDHNSDKCHALEEREHKTTRQHNQEKERQGYIRTEKGPGEGNTANEIRNMQKETQLGGTGRYGQQCHL